jgi:hypothetical protein
LEIAQGKHWELMASAYLGQLVIVPAFVQVFIGEILSLVIQHSKELMLIYLALLLRSEWLCRFRLRRRGYHSISELVE